MNCHSDEETNNLINVSIGLSKIVDKLPLVIDEDDLKTLDKVYDTEKYLDIAKGFLYISSVKKMVEQIKESYKNFSTGN